MNNLDTYKDISISSEVMGSSPAKHIALLLNHLQENTLIAYDSIQNNQIELKCKKLTNSYDIVDYFLDCLDFDADEHMASRLKGIYLHLQKLIFWANAKNDLTKLKEAQFIIKNLIKKRDDGSDPSHDHQANHKPAEKFSDSAIHVFAHQELITAHQNDQDQNYRGNHAIGNGRVNQGMNWV